MKHKYLIFFILLLFYSCEKDNSTNIFCETNPNTPDANEISKGKTLDNGGLLIDCVSSENIISSETEFVILDKGLQENGKVKGIKIDKTWESSIFIYDNDTSFRVVMKTYWTDNFGNYTNAEFFRVGNIPKINPIGCYNLSSNISSTDSIYCKYKVDDFDINLVQYTLDNSKENKLEILVYNDLTKVIKGKLKASFITDEPEPGYFPEEVRFFNIDFETY